MQTKNLLINTRPFNAHQISEKRQKTDNLKKQQCKSKEIEEMCYFEEKYCSKNARLKAPQHQKATKKSIKYLIHQIYQKAKTTKPKKKKAVRKLQRNKNGGC